MRWYVTDIHALLWHLMKSRKLSKKARSVFQAADEGMVQILVPSIVLIEVVYIFAQKHIPSDILEQLFSLSEDADANYRVVSLDMAVVRAFPDFGPAAVPEMADRIIAATARSLDAPLLTADAAMADSALVRVYW